MKLISQKRQEQSDLSFEVRATTALGISLIVDALDYIGAPIFALPVVGDVVDEAVMAILYRLTGSKTSTAINSLDLLPVIGDMIPAYTISTLLWILRESSHRRKRGSGLLANQLNHTGSINRINDYDIKHENTSPPGQNTRERSRTKAGRLYSIFRGRA